MSGHRGYRCVLFVGVVVAGLLMSGVATAAAHTHPTPIERAAPGVVYVEARAAVQVALIEHHQAGDSFGVHIGVVQSTWNPVLAAGSGFVVDPSGVIVTTAAIVAPSLERAKVFAVNEAFRKRYGAAAPLPADPFTRHHIGGVGNRTEERLRACYSPQVTNDSGGCVVRATLTFVVYPYVTSQQRYGALPAELLPGASKDVAVLRVRGANGMPTVPVAESAAGAKALGMIGFTGIPDVAHPLLLVNQHLAQTGASQLRTTGLDAEEVKNAARLDQALRNGLAGGPAVAENGQVIGLLSGPAPAGSPAPAFVGVVAIRQVLDSAGVKPHGGLVDNSFEAAMHLFKNSAYAPSIPNFKKTLELFPGHFLASQNLAVAQQHVAGGGGVMPPMVTGTMETSTSSAGAGVSGWVWVGLVAAGLVVVAAVLLLVLLRRRQGATDAGIGPSPEGVRAGGVAAGGVAAGGSVVSGAGVARPGGSVAAGPVLASDRPVARPTAAGPSASRGRTSGGSSVGNGSSAAGSPQGGSAVSSRAALRQRREGQESTQLRFCTRCGGRLSAEHKYCAWCGESVG